MLSLNLSLGAVHLTREAPGLVSAGEVLGQRSQLPGLVVIHPLRLLLNRRGPVSFMDLPEKSELFRCQKNMFHHLGKAVISVVWPLNSIILHQAVVKSTLKLDKYYQSTHNQLITNTFACGCHRCGDKQ